MLLVLLVFTATAQANPCIDPTQAVGWVAWLVVAFAAHSVEVFITIGFLLFAGIAVIPVFFALLLANAISYLGIVLPLYEAVRNVWLVEVVVVVAETALIKLLSLFSLFQQDTFAGLRWRYAFVSAVAGNACFYYIGTLLAASSST